MAKRKRQETSNGEKPAEVLLTKKAKAAAETMVSTEDGPITIQIIAGSYDKILHGVTATIPKGGGKADFADTFLFMPHTSPIKSLALSPPSDQGPGVPQKVMLASGGVDERINVYNLSAHPPVVKKQDTVLSSLAPRPIKENMRNREIGTLLHHSAAITALAFPTRSKLLSASEDSTIAVARTRDWNLLSVIKAPKPKAFGRASGDTQTSDTTPYGVNDFAIHPSMKLMVSVSRGERCMRLWNLVTGKKAGVLNFSRDLLQEIGERKHSTGEGQQTVWGNTEAGEEFAVMFNKDVVVFGMDSIPRCKVMPDTRVSVHGAKYVTLNEETGEAVMAVATGDGRIMFFSTSEDDLTEPEEGKGTLPKAKQVAQLGGRAVECTTRIKDFTIMEANEDEGKVMFITTGSSDGSIRVWRTSHAELRSAAKDEKQPKQIAELLGTYNTENRITCLESFIMIPLPEGVEESEDEDLEDMYSSKDDDDKGSDDSTDEEE
ncbi:Protein MAK11 [Zalerion maritima]|uniref:Protein MAK11 n=1 Tax=Zalerion maritima TaxID=339359 RepID=A0AAD5WN18_9PEZI|nr:Protein MAK11 [Zalerion maritima]